MTISDQYMIITDLDGTLLNSEAQVSKEDFEQLEKLGSIGVCRVVATGRSLFSLKRVIRDSFPVDFLIFSSGAGILDWKSGDIIYARSLDEHIVEKTAGFFINESVDFMIHLPIPDNHHFYFHHAGMKNADFFNRIDMYREFAVSLENGYQGPACQLLSILPDDPLLFNKLRNKLLKKIKGIHILRTSSPLGGRAIWMEVFPESVSKGNAAAWLCKYKGIDQRNTLAIGNDYNDIDLLNWAGKGYVVGNAAETLKQSFPVVESNNRSGFSMAVQKYLDDYK